MFTHPNITVTGRCGIASSRRVGPEDQQQAECRHQERMSSGAGVQELALASGPALLLADKFGYPKSKRIFYQY